jgi:Tfp pilus assembly protein PilN
MPTADGNHVMVSLRRKKSGAFYYSARKRNFYHKLRRLLLLHRRVFCGISSFWQSAGAFVGNEKLVGEIKHGFQPSADCAQVEMQQEAMADNLEALIPDDAFLCSIPLYFGDPLLNSFLSTYRAASYWMICIIINRELSVVFKMAPGTDALESHLSRVLRYWKTNGLNVHLPQDVYLLNQEVACQCQGFTTRTLSVKVGKRVVIEEEELRALGCALVGHTGGVGPFPGPAADTTMRMVRAVATLGSAAIVIMATLFTLIPVVLSGNIQWKLRSLEARYRTILTNNQEIKGLCMRNDSLVTTISALQKKSAKQTQWGRFLDALGENRPNGLYFDKLGSEPAANSSSKVRIAISGCAKSETLVTDLMTRLQKSGPVSNVSLSFLEKNEKNATICNFRILCIMNLIGD